MKNYLIYLLLFLCGFQSIAQTAEDYYVSGINAADNNDYVQAIALYSKAIQLDANYSQAYFNRSWCYYKSLNYPKALIDATKTIELNENSDGVYTLRGMIRSKMGNYNSATDDYLKALGMNPRDKITLNNMGAVKEKQGNLEDAIIYYQKAIEVDNNFSSAITNKNRVERTLQEKKELSSQSIGTNKKSAKDYFAIGVQAADAGDYEEAIDWYDKTVETDANYPHVYNNRGWAKYMRANYTGAIEDFTKSISYIPNDKWVYNQRGQAYVQIGKFEEGRQDFKKALLFSNDYQAAKLNLMAIENRLGVKIDEKAPKVIIISPTNSTRGLEVVKLDETVTILGRAEDESGIDRVLINGSLCNLDNGTGEFNASLKLNLGKNTITVLAFDTKGNKAEKTFVIERKSPDVNGGGTLAEEKSSLVNLLGTNYALIFATDEYDEWDVLSNPVRDGEAIAKELAEAYGFKVEIVKNATQREFLQKIRSYATKTFLPNDQLFIFGAGHGEFDQSLGEGYIVAKDSKKDDDARISYISQTSFRTYVDNIKCNHILVMLDVCFGGTFDPIVKRRGDEAGTSKEEFIARKLKFKARKYITSGGKEYVPDGIAGKHSPFAREILEALRSYGGADGILTVSEIISYIENLNPKPCTGEFGDNEPGSDFLFIAR